MAKDRQGQGQGQCRFGLDDTQHLFFMLSDSGGDDHGLFDDGYELLSPNAIALNTWTHVAITKTGAAFALLVNGSAVDTRSSGGAFAYGGPAVSFRIGGRVASDGTSVSGAFQGTIDEVRVWNVARTPAQITAAMKTRLAAPTPSLIGSWRFEEGAGTTTADGAGTHPGTLVGAPTWVTSTAY
jgi:hypothetical protein